jgi:hypothetical protein
VQKYFISLPPDRLPPLSRSSQQLRRTSNPAETLHSAHHHLAISTSARPRTSLGAISSSASPRPVSSISSLFSAAQEGSGSTSTDSTAGAPDPLVELRRASLDVLGALKEMELRYRLPVPPSPMSTTNEGGLGEPQPQDQDSTDSPVLERGPQLHQHPNPDNVTPPLSTSQRVVGGMDSSHFEASSDAGGDGDATTKGHLYRSDVTLDDLRSEKDVVRTYVEKVDEVIFASLRGRRGGARRGRSNKVWSVGGGGGGGVGSDGQEKHEGEMVIVVGEDEEGEVVRSKDHAVASTPTPKQRSLAPGLAARAAMSGAIGGASDSSDGSDDTEEEGALPDWAREGTFDGDDSLLRKWPSCHTLYHTFSAADPAMDGRQNRPRSRHPCHLLTYPLSLPPPFPRRLSR